MLGRDVDCADQREHAAGPLEEAAGAGDGAAAEGEQQRPDADSGRAERHDAARAEPVEEDAGDQRKRRVAPVEEPHQ